jgi:hypothetical protein
LGNLEGSMFQQGIINILSNQQMKKYLQGMEYNLMMKVLMRMFQQGMLYKMGNHLESKIQLGMNCIE